MTLDSLATKRVGVRRSGKSDRRGVTITRLEDGDAVELDGEDWIDLIGLVLAVVAYSKWEDGET